MRLNRFLAQAGFASRRKCEELILHGRVCINGRHVRNLATQVHPADQVTVNGKPARLPQPLVLMLHKPKGVVCSTVDLEGRRTVFDLLPKKLPRLFYVGRLDTDSEGLLLLTNQGQLAQRLAHPRYKLPKIYLVRLNQPFDFELAPRLLKGFIIEPGFAKCEAVYRVSPTEVKVILKQGLKRQIRHMFYKLGYEVKMLKRTAIGPIQLGALPSGATRALTPSEIKQLEQATKQVHMPTKRGVHGKSVQKKGHFPAQGKASGTKAKKAIR